MKYLPNMVALCWHNTLAYYAYCYAGIFDSGLLVYLAKTVASSALRYISSNTVYRNKLS